jgi:hypothetical protein
VTLRLASYFQGLTSAVQANWQDVFDSVPMLKSAVADGAAAVAGYIDTSTNWANATAKLWSFRNNGVEKAYVDRGGKVVASSFDGNGSAITAIAAGNIATGLLLQARGGTGIDTSGALNGQILIGKTSDRARSLATLTAGANITITNGAGAITIDCTVTASPAGGTGRYQVNNGAGGLGSGSLIDAETNKAVAINTASSAYPCWRLADSGSVGWVSCLGDFSDRARIDCGSFSMGTGDPRSIAADCFITRAGARTFQLGAADSATPLGQKIQVQGARGGTDTNTAGGTLVIASGMGTGTGTVSTIQFGVPVLGSSGTTSQLMLAALSISSSLVLAVVSFRCDLGTLTTSTPNFIGTATWNDASTSFIGIDLQIGNTASAAGSLLFRGIVSSVTMFSVDKAGVCYSVKFQFGTDGTGAGSAALGANCPAITLTAPYKWATVVTSDGSTGYVPIWK